MDDTNFLNYNNSVKRINKQVNQDLKNPTNCLNANKIFLNVSKTEVGLFKLQKKGKDVPLKLKLHGKTLYPPNFVKYHGINIDENLNWMSQISDIDIKLNKSNAILFKLRHFIDRKAPKSIYHAIFVPHLYYFSLVWTQN